MEIKNVLVCGFSRNEFIFLSPAIRIVLGNAKLFCAKSFNEVQKFISDQNFKIDAVCINCSIPFYELDLLFSLFPEHILTVCLSWQPVPVENIDVMLKHKADCMLFDMQSEDEFTACHKAVTEGKSFRSKGTFRAKEDSYNNSIDIYEKLSYRQKCAFLWMMMGKTQKEYMYDFDFKSPGTAATHWHKVLEKYKVKSVIELRNLFR